MIKKVFISYAREDDSFAFKLSERLREAGFTTYSDREVLVAGESWENHIEEILEAADIVVLILSRHTRRSSWVQHTLTATLSSGNRKQVIPVLLDDQATENLVWPLVADRVAIREHEPNAAIEAVVKAVYTVDERDPKPPRPVARLRRPASRPWIALTLALVMIGALVLALRWCTQAPPSGHNASTDCTQEVIEAVRTLLARQSAAWNRGDLVAFTDIYSEDASFLSPIGLHTGLIHGRQKALELYRIHYPNRKAMGTLSLDVSETRAVPAPVVSDERPCGLNGASVVASWTIDFPDQPDKRTAEGLILLVLQRHGDRWEIVQVASR